MRKCPKQDLAKSLKGKLYEEQLRSLGLLSLEEEKLRRPQKRCLKIVHSFLMRERRGAGTDLFSLMTTGRTVSTHL